MKSYREELWFETKTRRAFIFKRGIPTDIPRAPLVAESAGPSPIRFLSMGFQGRAGSPLTQASIRLCRCEQIADNADAHIKRQIMGRKVIVAVTKGKLDFGPWEQIFYGEFDGRRRKRVLVKIIGQ